MATITSVQDWLETNLAQNISILCEKPKIVEDKATGMLGSMLKKPYVSYRIRYKQPGRDAVTVRHRYSEFESIRSELRDRYHPLGIIVPPLPPKHSLNSAMAQQLVGMDTQNLFLRQRALGLTVFCENVVRIPWLRHDSTWQHFLKPNSGVAPDPDVNNTGLLQLLACLQQMDLPYQSSMVARIEGVKEEVTIMEKHVKLLLDRSQTVQKCEKQLQQAYEAFKQGLDGFHESEKVSVKALAGRTFNNDGHSVLQSAELVSTTGKGLVDLWAAKVESNRNMEDYNSLTLMTILEQELSLIDALKDLIKYHDDLQASIVSVSNKINSAKADVLQELHTSLSEKNTCLNMFYAGFMYFTLPLAARMRAYNMRKYSSSYVASQSSMSFLLHKACTEYFNNIRVSCNSAVEETNSLLAVLQTPPIPNIPSTAGEGVDSDGEGDGEKIEIIIPTGKANKSSSQERVQSMDTQQVVLTTQKHDKLPRGLSLSKGSIGLTGLFARALLHDRGVAAKVTVRSGLKSTGETQVTALKEAEQRSNPLAARRGSAVMSNQKAAAEAEAEAAAAKAAKDASNPLARRRGSAVVNSKTTPQPTSPSSGEEAAEDYASFRSGEEDSIPPATFQHTPVSSQPTSPVVNRAVLNDLLGSVGSDKKRMSIWEDV